MTKINLENVRLQQEKNELAADIKQANAKVDVSSFGDVVVAGMMIMVAGMMIMVAGMMMMVAGMMVMMVVEGQLPKTLLTLFGASTERNLQL